MKYSSMNAALVCRFVSNIPKKATFDYKLKE